MGILGSVVGGVLSGGGKGQGGGSSSSSSTNSSSTTEGSSSTTGTQGGLNVDKEMQDSILGQIMDAFNQQGGAQGGVAEMTPEMKAALEAMMGAQGGDKWNQSGSDMFGQAGNILGGDKNISSGNIMGTVDSLLNKDLLGNQLSQLGESAQEGLTKGLDQIQTGASMSGGLGSSRTALAEGEAITGSQKALANAQSNLINSAYQSALGQAIDIEKTNVGNQLNQGNILGQLGLGSGQLGAGMDKDKLSAMVQAGAITQEQADKLFESGGKNMNQLLAQLGALLGTTSSSDTTSSSTTNSSSNTNSSTTPTGGGGGKGGILGSVAGGLADKFL